MRGEIKGVVCTLLLMAGCWFFASGVKAEGEPNHIVISQVQVEGDAANDEFVELYNPTEGCLTLDGWSLQYKSSSGAFPLAAANRKSIPKVTMPAHTYYLIGGSLYNGTVLADATNTNFSLSGSAAGATVFLVSSTTPVASADDNLAIDKFGYGTSAETAPLVPVAADKPAVDWSFFRIGYTANNLADFQVKASNPRNFLLSAAGLSCSAPPANEPGDGASTTPESVGGNGTTSDASIVKSFLVKIYKFLPNPAGDDAGNEWVEIKNNDTQTVNVDGWLLDDKNTGSGPAADALALSGVIAPNEVKRISLPATAFALNNSGGDEVNLYFSDKILADTAVYSASAYDDGVFEYRDGVWQPPAQITSGGGGSSGLGSAAAVSYLGTSSFKINEIFANPAGDDMGKEWVEIYNSASATGSLAGFYLADGDSENWSSSAYLIASATSVPPLGFAVIILPKDSLSLNNSGKEKVKLFSAQKQLVDLIEYADAPENRSWAKGVDGKWQYLIPTPGKENNSAPEILQVYISEILPAPQADQDEFVELYNSATTTADLGGLVLRIGTKSKIFPEGENLPLLSYLVLYSDDLPGSLRNSGQDLSLEDMYGRIIAKVSYPKALAGESYARTEAGDFFWTGSPTPGEANQIVLAASDIAPAKIPVAPKAVSSAKTSAGDFSKLNASYSELKEQILALQEQINELNLVAQAKAGEIVDVPKNYSAEEENAPKSPIGSYKYLILSGGSFGILIFLGKKYLNGFFKKNLD